ncbi:hypothetical protein M432DRAFT_607651 [Thermoascus aurantiacus ATCC 26904]
MQGILTAKLAAFFSRSSESNYLDLAFTGQSFPATVYDLRKHLNPEHRQAFINAFSHRNPGPENKKAVRKMKHAYGVV